MYKNDTDAAMAFLRKHGAIQGTPKQENVEKLNQAAALCMSVYKAKPGDHVIHGWFCYDYIKNPDGSPCEVHDADGICYVFGDGCVIGLSQYTLQQSMEYCCVVGLHELSHVRFENHDDDFVSYHMTLCHDLLRKARINKFRNFFRFGG